MVAPEWLAALARYNRWMNGKLFELASTLTDEERKENCGAFFGSVHATLNHLLLADRVWLARFQEVPVPDGFMGPGGIRTLDQELYSDFAELSRQRVLTDDHLTAFIADTTPERLTGPLVYHRRGKRIETPLWWAVAHLFNHQTHHRGQITTLLNQRGLDPGVTDLFAMLLAEAPETPST